jgi:hypothetical protein
MMEFQLAAKDGFCRFRKAQFGEYCLRRKTSIGLGLGRARMAVRLGRAQGKTKWQLLMFWAG